MRLIPVHCSNYPDTGTNSAFTGLYIDHRATGTGNLALRIDNKSGDTSPFIIDGDGKVGIGTSTITGLPEVIQSILKRTGVTFGIQQDLISEGIKELEIAQ